MSQARLNTQPGQKKDMMSQQMQIMSFVMPFITFFIALNFPAGLALYWTTTSVFSMVQQYFVTGWGSLFSIPSLAGSGGSAPKADSRTYVGDARKEKSLLNNVVDADAEVAPERGTRANGYSNNSSSSSARRRRPNSASARRRGTAPKRNPSRS